jgi:segregation and condensation protein A
MADSAQTANAADLSSVFRQILERPANRSTLTVTNDAVMVRQMVDYLRDRLEIEDVPISLEEAIDGSRSPRIVTAAILALLEMVRLGAVLLRQDAQCASIRVKKSPEFQQVMDLARRVKPKGTRLDLLIRYGVQGIGRSRTW